MTNMIRTSTSNLVRCGALLIALALFASACGGGGADGASGGASSDGGGADLECNLLSGDFVASLFGEPLPVQDGQRDGSNRRAMSACEWEQVLDADSTADFSYVDIVLYGPGRFDQQVGAFDSTELDGPGDRAAIVHGPVDVAIVAQGDVEMEINIRSRGLSEQERHAAIQSIAAEAISNL